MQLGKELDELTKDDLSEFLLFMHGSVRMTQAQFAEALGVAQRVYGRWENGEAFPQDVYPLITTVRTVVNMTRSVLKLKIKGEMNHAINSKSKLQ
jgi:transcriptional regulator with XRE-family HTH domain